MKRAFGIRYPAFGKEESKETFPPAGKEAKTLACLSKPLVFAGWGSNKGPANNDPPPEKSKGLLKQTQDFSSSPARGAVGCARRAARKNSRQDTLLAQGLRNQSSPVEKKLRAALLKQNKAGVYKFRRQHPVHPYVADFACLAARVLIEIDGESHNGQVVYDKQREKFLRNQGFDILRFSNASVLEGVDDVVATIISYVEEKQQYVRKVEKKNA